MRTELIGKNEDTISNIFVNRGINPDSIYRLDSSALHSPRLIKNLEKAVVKVHDVVHFKKGKILIVQDPDADGYTSTAIIYNYLVEIHPEIKDRLVILIHEEKDHGIPVKQVEELYNVAFNGEVDLIIAPDCSSQEEDVHKYILETFGVPIIVLDHHDAEKFSDYAIMVNTSLDEYPNKNLSGAGVCIKFAELYDAIFHFSSAENYYDLAAVGIIADMIEINTFETIYIVQEGMRRIHNTFLKTLYDSKSFSLGGQVTPIGISFYIAPVINAMTRVGTMEEKKHFCKAITTQELEPVVSTKRGAKEGDTETLQGSIIRQMNNIKSRQDRLRDSAFEKLRGQIEDQKMEEDQIFILDMENEYPRSFTGLIANKFVGEFKKPTLVGSHYEVDGNLIFQGSARGDDRSDLPELKRFNNDSGLFKFAEGHEGAHGFAFDADKKEEIISYFNTELSDIVFEPVHRVDFDIDFKELSKDRMNEILRYSTFWGRGLEEPNFVLRNIPVAKETVEVGGSFDDHKLSFEVGDVHFLKFKGISTEVAQRIAKNASSSVDLVGTIKFKTYKGKSFYQVFVSDLELKESQKYTF